MTSLAYLVSGLDGPTIIGTYALTVAQVICTPPAVEGQDSSAPPNTKLNDALMLARANESPMNPWLAS